MSSKVWFAKMSENLVLSDVSLRASWTIWYMGVMPVPPASMPTWLMPLICLFAYCQLPRPRYSMPRTRGAFQGDGVAHFESPEILRHLPPVRKAVDLAALVDLDDEVGSP